MSLFRRPKPKDIPPSILQGAVDALPDAARWMSALSPTGIVPCGTGWTDYGVWPERSPKGEGKTDSLWANAVKLATERRVKGISYLELESPDATDGAILCYWPEHSLSDGASELASQGFYDCDCAPLADSWVGWIPSEFSQRADNANVGGLLLSWVPAPWFGRADAGLQVNAEQCIAWLTHEIVPGIAKALVACGHRVPTEKDLEAMGLHRFET